MKFLKRRMRFTPIHTTHSFIFKEGNQLTAHLSFGIIFNLLSQNEKKMLNSCPPLLK